MAINRRDFIRLGSAGLALGAVSPLITCPFMSRPLQAAMMGTSNKKMLLVFLRGGMDSLNVVIPHGDSSYSDEEGSRPTLFISEDDSTDLNGFASAAPGLDKLLDGITLHTDQVVVMLTLVELIERVSAFERMARQQPSRLKLR